MQITEWLQKFEDSWKAKDIDAVLNLFADKVEYWETPFKKLTSKAAVAEEWQGIESQENITITTNLFASEGNKHAVTWGLVYHKDGKQHVWVGTYFIELDTEGKCVYFLQTGEKK